MDPFVRRAIARIDRMQNDGSIGHGAGVLVAADLVLTAFHVVANRHEDTLSLHPGEIQLTFKGHVTKAVLHESYWDRHADWALLRCATPPPGVTPLPLVVLKQEKAEWETYGFPAT